MDYMVIIESYNLEHKTGGSVLITDNSFESEMLAPFPIS